LQSISGVSAINPLVAFYDIHGGKREVLFFYFVPDTTRDTMFLILFFIQFIAFGCQWLFSIQVITYYHISFI
jgi:hypothetical protein